MCLNLKTKIILIIFLIITLIINSTFCNNNNSGGFKIAGIINELDNSNNNNQIFKNEIYNIGSILEIPKENINFYNSRSNDNEEDIVEDESLFKNLIIDQQINLIICFGNFYKISNLIINQYNNITILIINDNNQIKNNTVINNNNNNNSSNIIEFNYPFKFSTFLNGYVSGLLTETDTIGYLKSNSNSNNNNNEKSNLNMFYFGAKLANPMVKLIFYTIENNNDYNNISLAIDSLIFKNADFISSSNLIDQNSFLEYSIKSNLKIIGLPNPQLSTTTPTITQSLINENNVLFNSVYNLTFNLLPIISNILNNNNNKINNNDLSIPNSFQIEMIFDKSISDTIKNQIYNNLTIFKNDFYQQPQPLQQSPQPPQQYENCNNLMKYNNQCIQKLQWSDLNNDQDFIYLGNFNGIEIRNVESKKIELSFTIISSIMIVILLFIIVCIYKFRNKPAFKSASPTFLIFIVIGGIVVFVGIIIWVSGLNDFTCNSKFWFVSLGFTIMISGMVVKNVRIWLIFDNPKLLAVKITNLQLFLGVVGMFLINIFLLSLLSGLGELKSTKYYAFYEDIEAFPINGGSVDQDYSVYQHYRYMCTLEDKGMIVLYFLLSYFGILIGSGIYVSWKIKIVPIEEFNESKVVAYCLYSIIVCLLIIIPLMLSKTGHNTEILCSGGVFMTISIIIIMFFPKFRGLFLYGESGTNEIFRQTIGKKKNNNSSGNNNNKEAGDMSLSRKNSKNAPKRVNLYLYDFTDDEQTSSSSSAKIQVDLEKCESEAEITETVQPNSEAANEYTYNDDPTYTEASEQPSATPRTNISSTPRTNISSTPRTNISGTPRTNISTPRTDFVLTPRTNLNLITPRTDVSNITPRQPQDHEIMSPRQYHNHMLSLSPVVVVEDDKNKQNSQLPPQPLQDNDKVIENEDDENNQDYSDSSSSIDE